MDYSMEDKGNEYYVSLKEDLKYMYTALRRHPSIIVGERSEEHLTELYRSKVDEICSYDSFIDAATELTCFFQDGHTNIEVPYSLEDNCIPLCCEWDEKGMKLVLSREYEEVPAKAEITSVNNITMENLILLMAKRIPHENIYLVKSRMVMYPYQNYHLFSEMSLKYLFGDKKEHIIAFSVNGKNIEKRCCLKKYNGFLDFADDDKFIDYEIQDGKMILHLNSCIFNEKYKTTLEKIAQLCQEQKIQSFILDLSQNMGGNSSVIDEFIKYTNVENFRRYEMTDYSSGEAKVITDRHKLVENQKKSICFPADMYCKVSCHTFSSARTFAVTLKDNGIARIIGSETGGKPSSYGMPKKTQTPNNKLRFRVSTSYFLRPDDSEDEAATLEMDVL